MIATQDSACRLYVRAVLQPVTSFRVVAEPCESSEINTLMRRRRPDIVLLDSAQASFMNGDWSSLSAAHIILMVPGIDRAHVVTALRFAARGIVTITSPPETLLMTIRRVAAGEYAFDAESIVILVQIVRDLLFKGSAGTSPLGCGLTSRELEIVAMIAAGNTNRQIAQNLLISERTVKHHLTAIFAKLRLSSRLELAMFAVKNQLPSPKDRPASTRRGVDPYPGEATCSSRL